MIMKSPIKKPVLNKRIFWDMNFEALDYDGKVSFIIERVFERGDVEDIRQCRRYYGDEKIIKSLLNAKYLTQHTLHFVSTIFDQPIESFRCYIQSNQAYFPY